MNRYSIYTKLVLFGCVISIIPVVLLGYFSYKKSSLSIQSHVDESSKHTLIQTNANIEQLLISLDYTLSYIINTNLVQESIYQELTFKQFMRYNNLTKELALLKSPVTKVDDVIMASYVSGWLINNKGLSQFDSFKYKDGLIDLMLNKEVTSWRLVETDKISSTYDSNWSCQYSIMLAKKMPYISAEMRGITAATIPVCSIAELINDSSVSEIMVLDEQNNIIIHPDRTKIGSPLDELGYLSPSEIKWLSDPSGQFRSKNSNRSITFIKSPFNKWTYISFTEMSEVTKEARAIGWFTVYVCLFIIGLSVLFVWLGSRNVYNPIRRLFQEISKQSPERKRIKTNEIQFINDHISEMFTSITSLTNELSRHHEQAMSLFLNKLYVGNSKRSETEEKLERFGLREQLATWKQHVVLTLQIDLLENTRYKQNDLDLLLFAINNIVEELIPSSERLPTIILDHTHVTLIGSSNLLTGAFDDYIYTTTEKIQQNVRKYLELDVSIGVSLPFHNLQNAARAYREGIEALKYRMKLGEGVIIPYFNINSGHHSNVYFYPKQIENEFIDAIRLADENRANEALKQWLNEVFHKEREPQEYQISLICLLNELMILMQEAGIPSKQLFDEEKSLYEQLLQLYISAEIEVWFRKKVVTPLIEIFKERQESIYQNLSEQIIDIIQNEYDKDITLEECASRLHYNIFYVSNIFKKETGFTFSEYLSTFRLNKAKKLLVESDLPIKDIALHLTYNNPQNFIRFFRKFEGMTPGQYRKKYTSN